MLLIFHVMIDVLLILMFLPNWPRGLLSFCYWFLCGLFCSLDYCRICVRMMVRISVAIGIWMVVSRICVVVVIRIRVRFSICRSLGRMVRISVAIRIWMVVSCICVV